MNTDINIEQEAEKIAMSRSRLTTGDLKAAIIDLCTRVRAAQKERDARLAEDPYGDEVEAFAGDTPKAVGRKIAAAIRADEGED